ncbi:pyrroloquinoline quinone biosynthesis protein PqqE [Ancylobacter sonchi]|uniref:pyrroloquinoline quinone biosynthesis protein PqqE n=1 Tax=Ancylobacter sonchi TaxID=1937790 RepID=UPI001BD5595B|nr:pyrroloquinoline quinone biosynthesis protein PqqE [Ancylobacter sonchi]MBS7535660.1 pyrroloquinoline quinone biosynthesis protein PqqE [Ancylobacter sonchi]
MNERVNVAPHAEPAPLRAPLPIPYGMLAELTHRCPLMCPYCSNPVELDRRNVELDTETWLRVFSEAAKLGVLQVHLSGGEPTARRDLEEMIRHCVKVGLYTNLITAGVGVTPERLQAISDAGIDHVQLSFQGATPEVTDHVSNFKGAHERKLAVAREVRRLGLPLTINSVVHRANIHQIPDFLELALSLGAKRIEIAHAQYYGWALRNRGALMPTREQVFKALDVVEEARVRLKGVLTIDAVVPDYYAKYPKACMNGWGRQSLNVTPSGKVLPCHAAEMIPSLDFWNVREHSLAEIWQASPAFNAFRGTDWMPELCRSCERKEIDWGGCRCQAMAIAGDAAATDPACHKSPLHAHLLALAEADAAAGVEEYDYRRFTAPDRAQ